MDTYPERDPREYLGSLETLERAAALVHRAMPPTPQYAWPLLCEALGTQVWTKHENHTPVGAFKLRGATNMLARLSPGDQVSIGTTYFTFDIEQ